MNGQQGPGTILRLYWAALEATGLLCGLSIGLICLGICADVILRLIGAGGIYWMLEAIEYLQFVVVMTGGTWVLYHGAHVSLDILVVLLPSRPRRAVRLAACVIGMVASLVFSLASLAATIDTWRSGAIIYKSLVIPEWWPLAFIAAGFGLMTVEFLLQLLGYERTAERMSL